MRGKYLLRRLGAFLLAALLIPGIAILSNSSAEAQGRFRRRVIIVRPYRDPFWRPWGWNQNEFRYSQYVFSNSERAFDQGYHDGLKTGLGDMKNRRTFNPERSHYFQEAGFGNFGEAYRSGFSRGYADGFRA